MKHMITVAYDALFEKKVRKIKDNALKERIKNHILKIIEAPQIGKPMRYTRHGTREVHIPPFRLSYRYLEHEERIVFLDVYHKDEQ